MTIAYIILICNKAIYMFFQFFRIKFVQFIDLDVSSQFGLSGSNGLDDISLFYYSHVFSFFKSLVVLIRAQILSIITLSIKERSLVLAFMLFSS
jgi:hypothetical protein